MKSYEFVKKSNGGWYLVCDNITAFTAVMEWKASLLAYGWMDIGMETEVDANNHRWGHPQTSYGNAIQILLEVEMERTGRETMPLLECINFLTNKMNSAFIKLYNLDGSVLVNSAGGCMMDDDTFETLQTIHKDKFVFPKEQDAKIRIIKWPNGSHYYAKIGNEDVVVDGEQSWNTRKAAQAAAEQYLAECVV